MSKTNRTGPAVVSGKAQTERKRQYFLRANYHVPIFGWVVKDLSRKLPGLHVVQAYSVQCVDGETGDEIFDEGVFAITEDDFEVARQACWNLDKEDIAAMVRLAGGPENLRAPPERPVRSLVPDPFSGTPIPCIDYTERATHIIHREAPGKKDR